MTVDIGITPFRPEPLPQHSASSYWPKDCVPTSVALCINKTTLDWLRPTPWNIRQSAQVLEYRGMSYGEGVMGAVTWTTKQGRKVVPTARYSSTRTDLKASVDSGHSCVVSISCYVTHNTLRETNDFTGNHSVSAHDYRWCTTASDCRCELKGKTAAATDHGEYLIEDPGTTTTGWRWWSAALLYKAAEFRTGDDGIDCIVFPDTEIVGWIATRNSEIRTKPSYQDGTRIKYATAGLPYKGGRTDVGGDWARPGSGTGTGRAWLHVVVSGTDPSNYKWGWMPGRAVRQAA